MANINAPFGFRPVRHMSANGHRLGEYEIASGLAENIAVGDLMVKLATGYVAKATAGAITCGVFMGVRYVATTGEYKFTNYWTSGTTVKTGEKAYALIADDPNQLFEVQTSSTINFNDLGAGVDMVDGTASATYGQSRQTVGATGGDTFIIRSIVEKPIPQISGDYGATVVDGYGMSAAGQYAILHVQAIKHQHAGAAAGVAI